MIHLYNTLGRRRMPFQPLEKGRVRMYVCGPTVQSEPHLGHGRSAVAFDAVRRYLTWRGYRVTYVRNVTDVDDKIIAAARRKGIPPEELAAVMTDRFRECFRALNVAPPDAEPAATAHIGEMRELIARLVERDLAYPSGGDVYFRVRGADGYGKLSGRNPDQLRAGARVEPGESKRDPLDFALWKGAKPGEPSWESPWGAGRPGWHIECSAMSAKYLGIPFDIHAGGADLIFPHHENEIAQSEGADGVRLANYWLHNGMVNLQGEKMSKSTGRLVDLAGALAQAGGAALRLFYLRSAYRSPLEFSAGHLEEAAAGLERLRAFRRRTAAGAVPDPDVLARFTEVMDDDFNTAQGLAVLFDAVREGNTRLDRGGRAEGLAAAATEMATALGLDLGSDEPGGLDDLGGWANADGLASLARSFDVTGDSPEQLLDGLIAVRSRAREFREWAAADGIRDGLARIGIMLEDTPDGVRWHRS